MSQLHLIKVNLAENAYFRIDAHAPCPTKTFTPATYRTPLSLEKCQSSLSNIPKNKPLRAISFIALILFSLTLKHKCDYLSAQSSQIAQFVQKLIE